MTDLSPEMRRVLNHINRNPGTPQDCKCSVATFHALARRKLIYVATSFDSIAHPRTVARAEITDTGRAATGRIAIRRPTT